MFTKKGLLKEKLLKKVTQQIYSEKIEKDQKKILLYVNILKKHSKKDFQKSGQISKIYFFWGQKIVCVQFFRFVSCVFLSSK